MTPTFIPILPQAYDGCLPPPLMFLQHTCFYPCIIKIVVGDIDDHKVQGARKKLKFRLVVRLAFFHLSQA